MSIEDTFDEQRGQVGKALRKASKNGENLYLKRLSKDEEKYADLGIRKASEEFGVGVEYLLWKKWTLNSQTSHHRLVRDYSNPGPEDDDDDEEEEKRSSSQNELHDQYSIELWPKVKAGTCVGGLVVEGGYMFKMDPDISSFPVITWHCPKLRDDGCPASLTTRITNVEIVRKSLKSTKSNLDVAKSLTASHVIENLDWIEAHANHRPGHYKDHISPLIFGLFSREMLQAVKNFCCCSGCTWW